MTRREFLLGSWFWLPFLPRRSFKLSGIEFRIVKRGKSARRYLHIHGDEQTAREVLNRHMKKHSGVAHMVKGNGRFIGASRSRFDPNRIFSAAGAAKNLKMLNEGLPDAEVARVARMLDKDREKLIRRLLPPPGGLLVALHNNSSGYSVKDEVAISDEVSLADPEHPHEFLLCTDAGDFALLRQSPFNAVLQQYSPREDDGSFSRVAAARGARYVNIEVELGKAEMQQRMLEWVEANLR